MTDLVVTQLAAEAWGDGGPSLDITSIAAEAWYVVTPSLIVSALAAEVWGTVPAATARTRRMQVL